jgi:DDE superfamily endonuclease/Helix-turn-helix of DDE superfamily endonuclease
MITYHKLTRRPAVARSLIGMSLAAFDRLYAEFEAAHSQRLQALTHTRRTRQPRQRAVGAGRRYTYSLCDRLLMTLFWLRVYTTYAVMGFLFELDRSAVEDNIKEVLATLEQMSSFRCERPAAERSKLRSLAAVMDAFPDVRLVIDAKEQRIQRPKAGQDDEGQPQDRQKPYYSGKKKTHTLKTQVAVAPDGRIEAVSASVPGGATHDLTLLRQTNLLAHLAEDEAAMLDKGYDGIRNDFPSLSLYLPFKARRNHPLTAEQKAHNRHLAKYRIVVEHTIAQLNQFQVLAQVYRHARTTHSQIFRIVAALVNRQITATPLKAYATA